MNRKFSMCMVLGGMFALATSSTRAQDPPAPPEVAVSGNVGMVVTAQGGGPGPETTISIAGPAAPFGGPVQLLGLEGAPDGKQITGSPFSAVAVTESTQTLADGNKIDRKNQANLYRDSQGRVRREMTMTAFGPLAASGSPKTMIMIDDPVGNVHYILNPNEKTAQKVPRPVAGAFMEGVTKMRTMMGAGEVRGNVLYQKQITTTASGSTSDENGPQKEDLGTQTIDGIVAQGTRYTHTIPAGQIGNEKPIAMVSEQWYSSDLQMVVKSTRSDPRFGETTYTLTNIQRTEPDASLFTVPSDYTINTMGPGKHMQFHDTLPPPPPGE